MVNKSIEESTIKKFHEFVIYLKENIIRTISQTDLSSIPKHFGKDVNERRKIILSQT